MIVVFLITLAAAAFTDIRERLRETVARSAEEINLTVALATEQIDRMAQSESGDTVTARSVRFNASSGARGFRSNGAAD